MKQFIFIFASIFLSISISANNQSSLEEDFQTAYNFAVENEGDLSLKYAFEALELANELNNEEYIGKCFLEISFDYNDFGNYTSSLNFGLKAASIFEKLNLENHLAAAFSTLGSVYSHLGNQDLAITYLKKALELKTNKHELTIAFEKVNLGDFYRLKFEYDSALHYFNEALITSQQYSDSVGIAYCYCNIGLVYLYKNEKEKGDSLIKLSFKLLEELDDYLAIVITSFEKAKLEFKSGNIKEAEQLADYAYKLAKQFNFRTEIRDILLLLSNIAQEKKDFKNAFKYLDNYQEYKDSLVNDKVVSQMAEMRAEFEIDRKQEEVNYFKQISKARTIISAISVFTVLMVSLLAIFLWRTNKERRRANKKLEEQNVALDEQNHIIQLALEEKKVLIKEIHHRVKNNLQIISSIINLQSIRIKNDEVTEVFNEMQRRIMAISSIHQKLYQSESVSLINMKDYLSEVVDSIHLAFNNEELSVNYEIAIQNVSLDIDAAVSIGLIVNELTTNAYKYAFNPNNENHLLIKLSHDGISTCKLIIKDNGPGIPKEKDIFNTDSLGLRMVSLLTRQLKGQIDTENQEGTVFTITFTEMKNKN